MMSMPTTASRHIPVSLLKIPCSSLSPPTVAFGESRCIHTHLSSTRPTTINTTYRLPTNCTSRRTLHLNSPNAIIRDIRRHTTTTSPSTESTSIAHFQPLYEHNPAFYCKADNIVILDEPKDFYKAVEKGIGTAKRRIVLASLYLGAGEARVRDALNKALTNNPNLEVHILLDYFRGTRGPKDSSVSLLTPLVQSFSSRVKVSLYHTPAIGGLLERLVPPRFNEGFGLQHMKIYIFDDDLILSGANLNTDYFVDRQDRYILFRDAGDVTEFYADLVRTVGGFSYDLVTGASREEQPMLVPPAHSSRSDRRLDRKTLKKEAAGAMDEFNERWKERANTMRPQDGSNNSNQTRPDTIIIPMIQMGQLGIRQEESVLRQLLELVSRKRPGRKPWTVHLSSGYLNFPEMLLNLIIKSEALFRILTAAPEANGFFGSKGVSRHLPAAYTHLEKKLLNRAKRSGRQDGLRVNEWKRSGWTFHAKGLWCTPPVESTPMVTVIGSSNFGYRSMYRDVEAQAVVLTENVELRKRLQKNLDLLFAYSQPVGEEELSKGDRVVPVGVKVATRVIRTML